MRVLDLFSGIGGFSLGLERAGMRTVHFCEIDPFCRAVLRHQWPGVPCHDDIRTFAGVECDVICGGFPCQDISEAGRGAGLAGGRSGLWSEYRRLVGDLRPRYVIVENVSALAFRGLGRVLGDLAEIGYDAEWHCIPACALGAPHIRERIWILAYPEGERRQLIGRQQLQAGCDQAREVHQWSPEPALDRVVDGFPNRMAYVRALGNAVVPQIPEIIGKAIMSASTQRGAK